MYLLRHERLALLLDAINRIQQLRS
jgi:hypothetical protein